MKLLIGELQPTMGQQSRNGRLRIACECPDDPDVAQRG